MEYIDPSMQPALYVSSDALAPNHVFVIDTAFPAAVMEVVAEAVVTALACLPPNARIALLTVGSTVSVYEVCVCVCVCVCVRVCVRVCVPNRECKLTRSLLLSQAQVGVSDMASADCYAGLVPLSEADGVAVEASLATTLVPAASNASHLSAILDALVQVFGDLKREVGAVVCGNGGSLVSPMGGGAAVARFPQPHTLTCAHAPMIGRPRGRERGNAAGTRRWHRGRNCADDDRTSANQRRRQRRRRRDGFRGTPWWWRRCQQRFRRRRERELDADRWRAGDPLCGRADQLWSRSRARRRCGG